MIICFYKSKYLSLYLFMNNAINFEDEKTKAFLDHIEKKLDLLVQSLDALSRVILGECGQQKQLKSNENWITIGEAAQILGLNKRTVERRIKEIGYDGVINTGKKKMIEFNAFIENFQMKENVSKAMEVEKRVYRQAINEVKKESSEGE